MIKPEELRIGNVVGSHSSRLPYWRVTADDIPFINNKPAHYFPVPLTAEWLERMGFKYNDGWADTYENGILVIYGNPFKVGWTIENIKPNFEIQYVHQLQNLYYALTNSEIDIKI